MRALLGLVMALVFVQVGFAQTTLSRAGSAGGNTIGAVNFSNYSAATGWEVTVTLTNTSAEVISGGAVSQDTVQQCNWGGVAAANLGSPNGIGSCVAGAGNTFNVTNSSGTTSQSVTAPAAPPQQKQATITGVNNTGVGLMIGMRDQTTGQYLDNTFQYVGPGQPYSVTAQSGGDNLALVGISQTQAQFDSFSSMGTGAYDGSGNLIAGNVAEAFTLDQLPYNSMTNVQPGGDGNNPTGTAPTTVTQAATNSSGGTVPNTAASTGGDATVVTGGATVVAFQSGTGTSQTGSTTAATNGMLAQVGNVTVQGDAGIIAAIQQMQAALQVNSGGSTTVTGAVSVSNFPTNFPDSGAIAQLTTLNGTQTAAKTDLDSIAAALGGVSGYDGGMSEVSAQVSAGNAVVAANSFGTSAAPGSPGSVGSVSIATGYPGDIAIDSSFFPSGMMMPAAFSWVSAGQVWSTADGYLKNARPLLALFECLVFAMSCGKAMRAYVIGLAATNASPGQFASENIIFGVPQAKTIAMATAFVTVLTGFIAAILALITGSLSGVGGTAVSAMTAATDLTGMGPGIGLINEYLPVSLTVSLMLLRGVIDFWMAPIFGAAASVIRFISL